MNEEDVVSMIATVIVLAMAGYAYVRWWEPFVKSLALLPS